MLVELQSMQAMILNVHCALTLSSTIQIVKLVSYKLNATHQALVQSLVPFTGTQDMKPTLSAATWENF